MREQLGFTLQVTGSAMAAIGLMVTWWQWSRRRKTLTDALARLVTRRTAGPTVLQLGAAFSAEAALRASGCVTRPGMVLEDRLTAIETDYGKLAADLATVADVLKQVLPSVDQARKDSMAYADTRIGEWADEARSALAEATLSGIWLAILGVLMGMAGLIVSGVAAVG